MVMVMTLRPFCLFGDAGERLLCCAGPFARACNALRHKNDEDEDYYLEYFDMYVIWSTRP